MFIVIVIQYILLHACLLAWLQKRNTQNTREGLVSSLQHGLQILPELLYPKYNCQTLRLVRGRGLLFLWGKHAGGVCDRLPHPSISCNSTTPSTQELASVWRINVLSKSAMRRTGGWLTASFKATKASSCSAPQRNFSPFLLNRFRGAAISENLWMNLEK